MNQIRRIAALVCVSITLFAAPAAMSALQNASVTHERTVTGDDSASGDRADCRARARWAQARAQCQFVGQVDRGPQVCSTRRRGVGGSRDRSLPTDLRANRDGSDRQYRGRQGLREPTTRQGCQLALDDFGAGFGSFYYLKNFPFDYLKIDGDFIRGLASSAMDQLVVKAIVGIARGMGKKTVAEFVADEGTVRLLREIGVDCAQGYHIGIPRPVSEVLQVVG